MQRQKISVKYVLYISICIQNTCRYSLLRIRPSTQSGETDYTVTNVKIIWAALNISSTKL